MSLFKKNTKHTSSAGNEIPVEIINKWKALKRGLATYLQRKSDILSMQVKGFILVLFCILFGGSSVAIIIHSATTKQEIISAVKIPKAIYMEKQKFPLLLSDSVITNSEYERIIDFKKYLFGLKNNSAGRKIFDSIITNRPRLLDSIALFEKMYLSQK
jgi:hypothetical protein